MKSQKELASEALSGTVLLPMDESTKLSFQRTLLSHERTQMAWIRTSTSLITFGFTVYKFFQFELKEPVRQQAHQIIGPRGFAMIMIAIGLIALWVATIQNYRYRQSLRKQEFKIPVSTSSVVGALITLLGLLAMFAAIFRW